MSEPPRIRIPGRHVRVHENPFSPKSQGNQKCTLQETQAVRNCTLLSGQSKNSSRKSSVGRMIIRILRQIILVTMEPRSECLVTARVKPPIWATLHFGSMCDDLLMLLPAQEVCASSRGLQNRLIHLRKGTM